MKTIHEYRCPFANTVAIPMPEGAEVLTVQIQNGEPHIWALVDTEKPRKLRSFEIVGTGQPADNLGRYVGTVQDGSFVWHVFEVEY